MKKPQHFKAILFALLSGVVAAFPIGVVWYLFMIDITFKSAGVDFGLPADPTWPNLQICILNLSAIWLIEIIIFIVYEYFMKKVGAKVIIKKQLMIVLLITTILGFLIYAYDTFLFPWNLIAKFL